MRYTCASVTKMNKPSAEASVHVILLTSYNDDIAAVRLFAEANL